MEGGHGAGLGALACGIAAACDLAQDLVGLPPGLLHRHPAVTADDDALVGRPAAAVAGAVVDEEGLDAGGVAKVLNIFRGELTRACQLLGAASLAKVGPELISVRPRSSYRRGP